MKKYLYLAALIITCFAACKKDSITKIPLETSFSSPAGVAKTYQTTLTTGDGWKATIVPSKSGMFGGYFKFETSGDSKYLLDNSAAAAATAVTTKYTIGVVNTNATLTFPSSSLFANFVLNYNTTTNKIDTAYTFRYSSAAGDTIKLVGNIYGSLLTFVKATKAESDDYLAGKMAQTMNTVNSLNTFKLYFKRTTLNGKDYDLIFNTKYHVLSFNYSNGGVFQRFSTYYGHTTTGLVFKQKFVDGTTVIDGMTGFAVDVPNAKATATSGATSITINNFAAPLIVDAAAVTRFNGTSNFQWISYTSFTRDGVVDYLNVRSIVGFSFIVHWIKYSSPYDWAGFTFSGTVNYGPALVSTASTTTGIIKYTFPGNFGTVPAASAATNTAMAQTYADTQGYYVFQTGLTNYDLVSVKDGRTWISYE